jgi:hypothetical protein
MTECAMATIRNRKLINTLAEALALHGLREVRDCHYVQAASLLCTATGPLAGYSVQTPLAQRVDVDVNSMIG